MNSNWKLVFLDLEAKRPPEEVGGWNNIANMGLAAAATYSTPSGELRIFEESDAMDLVTTLNRADCVIGHNCHRFHFTILRGLAGRRLRLRQTMDLLKEFQAVTSFRIAFETLVSATLGIDRHVDRSALMAWQREGRKTKVIEGLCQNVLDLERLYRFAGRRGRLYYRDRFGRRKSVTLKAPAIGASARAKRRML